MPMITPTVSRWELGARLRKLRTNAGLTLHDVAESLLSSQAKISRLETGERAPQLRDVRELGGIYGVSADDLDQLMELARQARRPGWWQGYELSPELDAYVGLEASALAMQTWEPLLIPGLFQTEDYTRAVLQPFPEELEHRNRDAIADLKIERRRRRIDNDRPQIRAVMDEAVLHRQVLPGDLMRAQFQRLLNLGDLPEITIQVLPFAAGAHVGVHGPFVVLDFEPDIVGGIVHTEGLAQQGFLEKPKELRRYRSAFELLSAAADSPERTRDRLRQLVRS